MNNKQKIKAAFMESVVEFFIVAGMFSAAAALVRVALYAAELAHGYPIFGALGFVVAAFLVVFATNLILSE